MTSLIEITKKNFKILKKKASLRQSVIRNTLGSKETKNLKALIYNESFKKAKAERRNKQKIVREQNSKLFTDLRKNKQTEIDWIEDFKFNDDHSLKDEIEGPKNDYCQHFVDTGQRPQNFIRDPGLQERFEEYPKLRELIRLKDELISQTNVPIRPMYLQSSLKNPNGDFSLMDQIGCEFDVILVEPPLHEYRTSNGVHFNKYYTWDEIKAIDVGSVASQRSFIFLWCGSGDGLDKGRECLKKWGFRRCEDICWIKTNKKNPKHTLNNESIGIFQSTKEHCLMGIKGTVRRSLDSNFIHTNIDIDLIITEEPDYGKPDKPEEIFNIIEHFCLAKRRLYLFGRDSTIRHGWLTVGPELTQTNFDKEIFRNSFDMNSSGNLTGSTERIEQLRPKTPPIKSRQQQNIIQQAQPSQPSPIIINQINDHHLSAHSMSLPNMNQTGFVDVSVPSNFDFQFNQAQQQHIHRPLLQAPQQHQQPGDLQNSNIKFAINEFE